MMRLSDYVIDKVAKEGVKHIFMVSGGGSMYLVDSLGRRKDIDYVCNHHEQACAMSAEGYQCVTGNLGVALVTSAPAGTNTITGIGGSWTDSIPILVISGQANSKCLTGDSGLRQKGVQETNITKIVEPITKYAVTIMDEKDIRYHIEKAIWLAKNGRPAPVWIDIPLDIQSKMIEPDALVSFFPEKEFPEKDTVLEEIDGLKKALEMLKAAKRPIILAGHGIRLANIIPEFLQFIETYKIPVVTTKLALDLIEDDHELLAGRIGINGQRAGNFAVQNADLVLALGSRLSVPTVGYASRYFAREAKKIVVDIDATQLKYSTVKIDLPINMDLRYFIRQFDMVMENNYEVDNSDWIEKCHDWRRNYPVVQEEWKTQKKYVSSYYFFDILSEEMDADDILVTDQGATFYCTTVAFKVKRGQRVFTNGGFCSMGYGLPAAIGACFGNGKKRVICAHGDGGLEMNVQELQTIVHYKLPIKLFVFNNSGYQSIRHTQTTHFSGFFVGCDVDSGVSCPSVVKLAKAYGIKSMIIRSQKNLRENIRKALSSKGSLIIEVIMNPNEAILPKVASQRMPDGRMVSKPLEDMFPFLDREVFKKEMIIKPIE